MLNEHDLRDFPGSPLATIKLYELPRNSVFRFEGSKDEYTLNNIDGMYSYCMSMKDGKIEDGPFHFAAFSDVIYTRPFFKE
jgi:hypothetical protein